VDSGGIGFDQVAASKRVRRASRSVWHLVPGRGVVSTWDAPLATGRVLRFNLRYMRHNELLQRKREMERGRNATKRGAE
jgi:hypothetical protein